MCPWPVRATPSPSPPRAGSRWRRRASARRGRPVVGAAPSRAAPSTGSASTRSTASTCSPAPIICPLSRGSAPTTAPCSTAPPGAEGASGACSNIGRTKPRCCRSRSTPCCAGGWRGPSAAKRAGRRLRAFARERRAEAEAVLARIRDRGADGGLGLRAWQEPQRLVGMGRRPSMRSNGCSGPAASPPRPGAAASSGSTTSPSG